VANGGAGMAASRITATGAPLRVDDSGGGRRGGHRASAKSGAVKRKTIAVTWHQ